MNVETIRRKVTKQDVEEIARLMATRRLTETGCCLIRGISDKQWWNWKSKGRNKEKFTDLFTRIRESKLDLLVERIENASEDAEISVGDKIVTKRGDWRAAAWLTEKIAPERFAQQINQSIEKPQNPLMLDAMKRVYATVSLPPAIPERSSAAPQQDVPPASPRDLNGEGPTGPSSLDISQSIDNRADDQSAAPASAIGFNSLRSGQTVILPVRRSKEGIKVVLPTRRRKE